MDNELLEMTIEELWRLFPISLVDHNDKWDVLYKEVETLLYGLLSRFFDCRISHIGSTAIFDIKAKNIVDVLVEIPCDANIEDVANLLGKNDFIRMSTTSNRISLNKGYTKYGFADKVYHIHLRFFGDNDELYFRDYLNEFPKVAKEYELLKMGLWKKYEYDRDAYTEAKGEFIRKWTNEALKKYKKQVLTNSHFTNR